MGGPPPRRCPQTRPEAPPRAERRGRRAPAGREPRGRGGRPRPRSGNSPPSDQRHLGLLLLALRRPPVQPAPEALRSGAWLATRDAPARDA
eukprot:3788022-Alexandrium_andersonii.AAC.1